MTTQAGPPNGGGPLLDIAGLELSFVRPDGALPILRGVDIVLRRGEIVGLVGETGAGKSMTARALLGLLDPSARMRHEHYIFDGSDVSDPDATAPLRGHRIGYVPQHPRGSLNPVFSVGTQLTDTIRRLRGADKKEAHQEAIKLMRQVQIPEPERRMKAYPHELSGGMCQRICIAIALAGHPDLIIADEPTTGLDVTIQAEILALLTDLIRDGGSAGLLITHDIGVVAEVCDRVAVMYAGRIVDTGPTAEVFSGALHPYAALLLRIAVALDDGEEPEVIAGSVPIPGEPLDPCAFAPRCPRATEVCRSTEPVAVERAGQLAFCHHPLDVGEDIAANDDAT
jgi:oligopeptide/dipeptide ABC transporter ATP-binding protein